MEFTARTVTHPNPRIEKVAALKSLKQHPEFKPGTIVVSMEQKNSHWVATLHEPKLAGPPPFLDDEAKTEGAPSDDVKPEDSMDDMPEPDEPKEDGEDKKDDKKSEKPSLEGVMDLIKQIAQAVGVPVDGGDKPDLGDMKEPMDDPMPPMPDTPPAPPKGGPEPKEMIHRKAPVGVTPIGSPSFASAKPKVASFDVEEPWNGTIREAKDAIEGQYGDHGYKVKKIREDVVDGQRVVRARVSVR